MVFFNDELGQGRQKPRSSRPVVNCTKPQPHGAPVSASVFDLNC